MKEFVIKDGKVMRAYKKNETLVIGEEKMTTVLDDANLNELIVQNGKLVSVKSDAIPPKLKAKALWQPQVGT